MRWNKYYKKNILIALTLVFTLNCKNCSEPKCEKSNFSFTNKHQIHHKESHGHKGHRVKGTLHTKHGHRKITHVEPNGTENDVFAADWHLPPVFAHSKHGGILMCINTFIEPDGHDVRCGLPHHENGVQIQCSYKEKDKPWSKAVSLADEHKIKWITHLVPLPNNQFTLVYQVMPASFFADKLSHHGEYRVNFNGNMKKFHKAEKRSEVLAQQAGKSK